MKKYLTIGFITLLTININAQINQYSGAYSFKNEAGKATYQYTDTDEGRSYNGFFKGTTEYITITGNYTDNKKDGLWTIIRKPNWNYSLGLETTTLNFKDGKLSGEYHYSNTMSNDKTQQNLTKIDASYLENHFVGSFHYYEKVYDLWKNSAGFYEKTTPEITECIGQFDTNGYATGKWIFKKTDKNGLGSTNYKRFNMGVLCDSYSIDNSTGEKTTDYSDNGKADRLFTNPNNNMDSMKIESKYHFSKDSWIRIKTGNSAYSGEVIIDIEIKQLKRCWYDKTRLEQDFISRGQEEMKIYPTRQLID